MSKDASCVEIDYDGTAVDPEIIGKGLYKFITLAGGDNAAIEFRRPLTFDGGVLVTCAPGGYGIKSYLKPFTVNSGLIRNQYSMHIKDEFFVSRELIDAYDFVAGWEALGYETAFNPYDAIALFLEYTMLDWIEACGIETPRGNAYSLISTCGLYLNGGTVLSEATEMGVIIEQYPLMADYDVALVKGGSLLSKSVMLHRAIGLEDYYVIDNNNNSLVCVTNTVAGKPYSRVTSGWTARLPSDYDTSSLYLDGESKLYFWVPKEYADNGSYDLGFYKGYTDSKVWTDSLFVTTTQYGTTAMTSFAQGSKIYLYYGFANLAGNFDMGGFVNRFTLSTGTTFEDNWSNYTLAAGKWGWGGASYSPAALQDLAPGTYTLTCTLDATDKLSETNEGNNTKAITFSIVASDLGEGEHDPLDEISCLVTFDPISSRATSYLMLEGKTIGAYGDLPVPTRSGYTFVGWFTATRGGTQVTASTKVTGDVTYYARWEKMGGDDLGSGSGSVKPTDAPSKEIVKPWTAMKAVTMNGAMYDATGNVVGVVQLKIAKPNIRKMTTRVSGYVMSIDGKKATLTTSTVNVSDIAPMNVTATARSLGSLTIKIGDDGFSGEIGNYTICMANVGGSWTRSNAKVYVDATSLPAGTIGELLPVDEPILARGGKWAFNKGTSVKLSKDKTKAEWDTSGGKSNLSSMKLTYTSKTGLFKGSFKVYALESATGGKKKLKKYTANVTGVVVDGRGYGQATIKKPAAGPWTVTVE